MSTSTDERVEQTETPTETDPQAPQEPETGDGESGQDDEPGDEPQAPQAPQSPSEGAIEQTFSKAQKRAETYMKAIPDILRDAASDLSLCPRCTDFLPGWILPLAIKPVVGDQLVAVKQSLGEGMPRELKQDKRASQCPDCGGEGKVVTGSNVRGQAELRCEDCNGRGWIGPRVATVTTTAVSADTNGASEYPPPPEEAPATDPWGRLRGDPLYGVMPGFES